MDVNGGQFTQSLAKLLTSDPLDFNCEKNLPEQPTFLA